ncbi:MAG: N-succinylarginine dihydrolase, partial [Alphaproteobacteria bacterium]|nr:N-succinylarginine dihydrolase [Alphaproteobacteria bacterium]
MTYSEYNFDGLIGPTHNYAGLSFGNLASASNAGAASNPREAALQGLGKMREVMELGLPQGFLPPQDRPHLKTLRALGFSGTDKQIIERAAKTDPQLLANCYAASTMWTANAGTVAPSPDTRDG